MNRTRRTIATRILAFVFAASAMTALPAHSGTQTVDLGRPGPCSTCGLARPVLITCNGLDWDIRNPGTIAANAANVCGAGSAYTWKDNA